MTIEDQIKTLARDTSVNKTRRKIYRTVLGEFNRQNDGKPVDDTVAVKVLEKMVKGARELRGYTRDYMEKAIIDSEIDLMESFIPSVDYADDAMMEKAIAMSVPAGTKNKMSCMKPCIHYLEDKGYTVNKRRLAELLRG